MSHAKMQHYVPRFLLAAFEISPDSGQVYAYDKRRSRTFLAGVHNVAGEKGLYDIVVDDVTLSFEPALSELESEMAVIVNDILQRQEIGFLSTASRHVVAQFVAVQSMRTRQFLEVVHESGLALAEALDEMDPGSAETMGFTRDRERSRVIALSLLEDSSRFAPLILAKAWGLYETTLGHPFWICDHPVVMQNNVRTDEIRGTLGLGVEGIEIYMPIAPRYCLGFICPTLRDATVRAYAQSLQMKMAWDMDPPFHEQIGALRDGLEYGFPIPSVRENVDYVNSLQVMYAERFVFANHSDFEMIEEMIAEDANVRRGPRPSIG